MHTGRGGAAAAHQVPRRRPEIAEPASKAHRKGGSAQQRRLTDWRCIKLCSDTPAGQKLITTASARQWCKAGRDRGRTTSSEPKSPASKVTPDGAPARTSGLLMVTTPCALQVQISTFPRQRQHVPHSYGQQQMNKGCDHLVRKRCPRSPAGWRCTGW